MKLHFAKLVLQEHLFQHDVVTDRIFSLSGWLFSKAIKAGTEIGCRTIIVVTFPILLLIILYATQCPSQLKNIPIGKAIAKQISPSHAKNNSPKQNIKNDKKEMLNSLTPSTRIVIPINKSRRSAHNKRKPNKETERIIPKNICSEKRERPTHYASQGNCENGTCYLVFAYCCLSLS